MAAPTQKVGDTTYSSTTADTAITLTDDAFSNVQAIAKLTDAINKLTERIK